MTAESTLVIILSITLAIFLVVGIIVMLKIKDLLNTLQRISDKAEKFAEGAESMGEFFKDVSGNLAIGKLIHNMAHYVKRKKRER